MKLRIGISVLVLALALGTIGSAQTIKVSPPDCGQECPDPGFFPGIVLWFLVHMTPGCAWFGFCGRP